MPDVSQSTLAEIKAHHAEVDKQVKQLQEAIAAIRKRHETKLRDAKLTSILETD